MKSKDNTIGYTMKTVKILTLILFVFIFLSKSSAEENLQDLSLIFTAQLNQKVVVVTGFSCTNDKDPITSSIIQERLITFLAKNNTITVVERSKLDEIFNEQQLQLSGVVDVDTAQVVGKLTSADVIITGTFTYLTPNQIEINARAISIVTGNIIATASVIIKKDWYTPDTIIPYSKGVNSQKYSEYLIKGIEYFNQGKYSIAIEFFNRAISLDSDFANGYFYRGLSNYNKGKFDDAINDYTKALEINPELHQAYYHRGIAYTNFGKFDMAIDDLDKAIELYPHSSSYYTARGEVYIYKNEWDKAFADFNNSIKRNPRDDSAYAWRGYIFFSIKGDNERAIQDYNKAIEISPQSIGYLISRAEVYYDKGEYTKALNDCNKAIKIDPNHAAEAFVLRDIIKKKMSDKKK